MIALIGWIVFSQALGIGLAVLVDHWTQKWRCDEKLVFAVNLMTLVVIIPLLFLFLVFDLTFQLGFSTSSKAMVFGSVLWIGGVTVVQGRQTHLGLRASFFAALFQFLCFCLVLVALSGCRMLVFLMQNDSAGLPFLTWNISALATYGLLALFRPTITGMLQQMRLK